MIIRSEIQFQGLHADQSTTALWNEPHQIQFVRRLNDLSRLVLVYPPQFEEMIFSKENDFSIPGAMRVIVEFHPNPHESNETKEVTLFRGFLETYESESGGPLSLTFVDPLVVSREVDQSIHWQDESFQKIVREVLSSASTEIAGKKLEAKFRDLKDFQVASLTNMGREDFEFLLSICAEYGVYFFYDHQSSSEGDVVFTEPTFSTKSQMEISIDQIEGQYRWKSHLAQFPSRVSVADGKSVDKIDSSQRASDFSEHFRKKADLRQKLGVDLNFHHFLPLVSATERKRKAEALFMNQSIGGDQLIFYSERFLELGEYVSILASKERGRVSRVEGKYWIAECRSDFDGFSWQHQYRGVRP